MIDQCNSSLECSVVSPFCYQFKRQWWLEKIFEFPLNRPNYTRKIVLPTQTERGRLSLATESESRTGNDARIYRFLSAVALKRRLISLALNDYLTSCSSLPVKLSRMLSRSTISWLLSTSSDNENIQLSISILVFQTMSTSPPITNGEIGFEYR